jgi:hypothetical protein
LASSPTSDPYATDLALRFFTDASVGLRDPILGRERRQASPLEHHPADDGPNHED